MRNNKGFSLVELIVVIAIMAILAAVAIPTFATFIDKANIASDVSFVNDVVYAAELAHTATGDKVTEVAITLKADGTVDAIAYKVGDVAVTIDPDAETNKVTCSDNDIKAAAEDTIKVVDTTYKFKKYTNANSWKLSDDGKTLVNATAAGGTQ